MKVVSPNAVLDHLEETTDADRKTCQCEMSLGERLLRLATIALFVVALVGSVISPKHPVVVFLEDFSKFIARVTGTT